MRKAVLAAGLLACAGLVLMRVGAKEPAGTLPYTRFVASAEVQSGGAGFKTETEDRWSTFGGGTRPIDLRLRITNHGAKAMVFPYFDAFFPVLTCPDGSELPLQGGRNGTRLSILSFLLEPGQDYSIVPSVRLRYASDSGILKLEYEDATGSSLLTGPLAPGKYTVAFRYHPDKTQVEAFRKDVPGVAVWEGQVETQSAAFEIVKP